MTASVADAHRLLTIEEFDRAGRTGVYGPEEKLELIEGEVFRKMSPQESEHSTGIRAVEVALNVAFAEGHDVRVQMPLEFGSHSKPEPDVAVVVGNFRDYRKKQPTTAVLVVEVSDTTLRLDRTKKAALYAKSGIQEYWIVILRDRVIEVYRQPALVTDSRHGHEYLSVTRHSEGDSISPLEAPNSIISVSDLLP
jgi:Uma2 family endonuclease